MVRCRRACHSQDDRHQKTLIDTREFGDQHDGRQRHAHGGREERRRADDGVGAERRARPGQAPQPAQDDGQERTDGDARRQQAARGPGA
ncbi:hypothetical protein G6F57_020501 [Rhizopus arrhizus]|nr:hypothetical protein G6F35_012632 [Rhizopus arrhizus]KAG1436830.1 hypothetical protein G6F57_020501 [Rhizopus arrhizus]